MEKKYIMGIVIAIVLVIAITATSIFAQQPAEIKEPTCGCTGGCKCLETQQTCGCNQPTGCNCKNSCHA